MRYLLSLLVFCIGFHASAADQSGAELQKKPVKAEIVSEEEGGGEGNVRVTYADGTSDFWTTKGHCSNTRVAPDGTVGWVVNENLGVPELPRAFRSTLVLCRRGQIVARIGSGYPVIWGWAFLCEGKQVALQAGWYHASPRGAYELYDVAAGKCLKTVPEDEPKLPDWAKALKQPEE